jgi:hypothetical protein
MSKELDELEEAKKSSFEVDAEVPDPEGGEAEAPGGKKEKGDKSSNPVTPGSTPPKSKVTMINKILDATKGMTKEEVEQLYTSVCEGREESEPSEVEYKISAKDLDISEDVKAMFSGQDLTEEFVTKASTIFEAAVVSKVNEILESASIDLDAQLEAEKYSIQESMAEKLNDYLDHVVESWVAENEIAIESGIRSEIAENFMLGLKNLFLESYIEVPEEKVDVAEELAMRVSELEEMVNEESERAIALKKELSEAKKINVFSSLSEGLSLSQVEKLKSLSEGVEFETEEYFREKIKILKENYFPKEGPTELSFDDEGLELGEEKAYVDPSMAGYMSAISKSIKK